LIAAMGLIEAIRSPRSQERREAARPRGQDREGSRARQRPRQCRYPRRRRRTQNSPGHHDTAAAFQNPLPRRARAGPAIRSTPSVKAFPPLPLLSHPSSSWWPGADVCGFLPLRSRLAACICLDVRLDFVGGQLLELAAVADLDAGGRRECDQPVLFQLGQCLGYGFDR